MSEVAVLEQEVRGYREQLDVVKAGLKDDPENEQLLLLQNELGDALTLLNETLAELKPAQPSRAAAAPSRTTEPSPPPAPPKWSREDHPAFKKAAAAAGAPGSEEKDGGNLAEGAPVNYKVNDNVMAKWLSGDKAFYPARITSMTGSSNAPIYIVKFKSYDNTEQLRAKDIRPMAPKRKADVMTAGASGNGNGNNSNGVQVNSGSGNPPISSTAPITATTHSTMQTSPPPPLPSSSSSSINAPGVISAAASINPELAQKNREAAQKAADEPNKPKFKKIKATKELEASKNSWQAWNTKGKVQKNKKDSMFRTPEGVHGRVGFTGSGQAMRKDPTRSRHIYQANEDLD